MLPVPTFNPPPSCHLLLVLPESLLWRGELFPAVKGLFVFLHLVLKGKAITVLGVFLSLYLGSKYCTVGFLLVCCTRVHADNLQLGVQNSVLSFWRNSSKWTWNYKGGKGVLWISQWGSKNGWKCGMWSETTLCLRTNHFFSWRKTVQHSLGAVFCVTMQQDILRIHIPFGASSFFPPSSLSTL